MKKWIMLQKMRKKKQREGKILNQVSRGISGSRWGYLSATSPSLTETHVCLTFSRYVSHKATEVFYDSGYIHSPTVMCTYIIYIAHL